ncbi:hypothetical protein IQ07DRAFT_744 [Pyrenochaeta sp. DS3sAY3a]|nr:hypothetical protein IQ07DRAFT_744 [Pyrenochaeta sp. DS3sAY3a]
MAAKKKQPQRGRSKTPVERHRSETPGVEKERTPALLLKINLKRKPGEASASPAPTAPVTTRHGRKVRPPQFADAVYGDEVDALIKENSNLKGKRGKAPDNGSSSAREDSLHEYFRELHIDSSPAGTPAPGTPATGFHSDYNHKYDDRRDSVNPQLRVLGEAGDEVLTWDMVASQLTTEQPGLHNLDIDKDTRKIFESLQSSTETLVDLPSMSQPSNPTEDEPYTAKRLTHLYLLCYEAEFWNGCDLIADTWIRAFHELREHSDITRPRTKTEMLWRRNSAREQQKRILAKENAILRKLGQPSLKSNGPEYGLVVEDPLLADDVTMYDVSLVNALYANTARECGARLLWAEAMTLCGDAAGEMIENGRKMGKEWHAELQYDVLQTALRMLRKRLTLKIEETVEGAWCKRYHEHTKHGLPCYRETAFHEEQDAEGESEEE